MLISNIYLHELLQANDRKSMCRKITSKNYTRASFALVTRLLPYLFP